MTLDKESAQQQLDNAPQSGEVWRHYKGGLYSIVCSSVKEDSLEPLVTYHSNKRGKNWTRTLANFTENVEVNGVVVSRFTQMFD